MFIWFKGKILNTKERINKGEISLANEKASNILSHDEFVNITEELSEFLENLKGNIESDKSELAQVKIEFEEKENKMEALNNNLGNEANYNKWLSEEVDLLEETKNKINKRAKSVPSHFTYEYCSKITKQIDSFINDIKNFPNTHIKNIENLRSEINKIGYVISDGKIKIKELKKNIASNELKQKEVSYILESRKQFDLEKLQPLIDEYKRINLKIDQIKVGRGSHEDYSNEKQTLFNLKERIEKEIRIYENSDFINNKSNILKLCKHCGGNGGCLHCNNTGYEDH